jgi:hypothetical protein
MNTEQRRHLIGSIIMCISVSIMSEHREVVELKKSWLTL